MSEAIPMLLWCPNGHRHVDEGELATKVHHTHACQDCGVVWRPAIVNTVGVQFLPGFKNEKRDGYFEDGASFHGPSFSAGADPNMPDATVAGWWHVLGFPTPYQGSLKDYEKAYRERVKHAHPDVGGSEVGMTLLNAAIAAARDHFGGK